MPLLLIRILREFESSKLKTNKKHENIENNLHWTFQRTVYLFTKFETNFYFSLIVSLPKTCLC